ncbi:ParB/RepB/Spo0J family partition protein [Pseudohongiella sp.]|uniref:HTH cro/C1-type domain-containing protein n=1 Tax=marine sediment metagenome TaxID=412755 RepID=A0A0F9W9B6_9ZZZZ|nr:ParB/RepB/Spo0J family partition protein [Pseudohongiella sp.]HDZ08651.1 ParB/RepB/Spo0J family partition protein [Pseudohongiella sp.]HEA62267.1 ParB/RepB/Spo0J family partition protein [Pseudohongiella sp.]
MSGKKKLGRGLDKLLGSAAASHRAAQASEQVPVQPDATPGQPQPRVDKDSELRHLPVELIQRGKYQPRTDMHEEALQELAESIKVQGVMQPIVVRPVPGDRYEIIAGERRWRATQLAGLDTIPAVIRLVGDESAIAMSLIENIQRENLNPIEEAMALKRLQEEFELTQQEVAEAVGKSRTTVTNLLRLMSLSHDVRLMLERGDLEMGHARALLGLPAEQQSEAAKAVSGKGLSVRQTESMVRRLLADESPKKAEVERQDPDIASLEDKLSERIGAKVQIQHSSKGSGKLTLRYNSLDELDGILAHIK